ncbi:MAG: glycogen debranching enzyme family protein [Sedimentisphaerales bacterium]|nr:glycogen debranching enzyme family protein [Sedimentisphaerales bacterium]
MLEKTKSPGIECSHICEKDIGQLLEKEWLLTNERGGYSSSSIICCNTRRYHGLLVGSLNPPVDRIVALSNCLEMLIFNGSGESSAKSHGDIHRNNFTTSSGNGKKIFNLSTFEFSGKIAPQGYAFLRRFHRNTGAHFDYVVDGLKLTKSIYLDRKADTIAVVYDFTSVTAPAEFVLRPFVALRDFHTLQRSYAPLCSTTLADGLLVYHDIPDSCQLNLRAPAMSFVKDKQWWFNFLYRTDKDRGQDFTEDLWSPGFFKCQVDSPVRLVLWANLDKKCKPENLADADIERLRRDLQRHQDMVVAAAKTSNHSFKTLCLAADQFITNRQMTQNKQLSITNNNGARDGQHNATVNRVTMLAGFPWFADWGRDAFVALPGLLLDTGRFEQAKSVLTTFAQASEKGMIPNRFDDRSNTAYFNSVDASLWFVNAAFQYFETTKDSQTMTELLLPTIHSIIDSYYNGTIFNIKADTDGLITAGNSDTQLTWMDAKCGGEAFTPRYGKVVEVNVLWFNVLSWLAKFYASRDEKAQIHFKSLADKVAESFCRSFWNDDYGYLNDCILPEGLADGSLRPNQIFAVSLPFSPLTSEQQKSVVEVVRKHLLTPYGLRTLSATDNRYRKIYAGPQCQRDEAYHQGTVWSYLIGPFVEAYLKVNDFSRKSKKETAKFIQPLLEHLKEQGCLGQVSEIFDADAPHQARGCMAQAWSVAELIRAYKLIYG